MSDEPKRHRIELTCPDCGHRQQEPTRVVSSQCRACQTHFQVVAGKAVSKNRAVQPFARIRKEPVEDEEPIEEKPKPSPPIRTHKEPVGDEAPEETKQSAPPIRTRKETVEEKIVNEPRVTPFTRVRKEPVESDEAELPRIRPYSPSDRQTRPPGDPRPFWLKLLQPSKPPRETSCFECGAPITALGDAQSSQCPKCGSYVSLQNYDIDQHWNRRIQTRGDVKILKSGSIAGASVRCHHLTVLGELSGSVECSGDLIIRSHGKIIGAVVCRNLRIEKGAKVEFLNPVKAETARIDGEVHGQISCSGSVTLEKRAQLHGLVRTASLVVKPGAKHSGMIEMVSKSDSD